MVRDRQVDRDRQEQIDWLKEKRAREEREGPTEENDLNMICMSVLLSLSLSSNHSFAAGVPGEEPRCSVCREGGPNPDSQLNQKNQILICGKCGIGE